MDFEQWRRQNLVREGTKLSNLRMTPNIMEKTVTNSARRLKSAAEGYVYCSCQAGIDFWCQQRLARSKLLRGRIVTVLPLSRPTAHYTI